MSADSAISEQNPERIAADFLRAMFGGQPTGVIALFCKPGKQSIFIPLNRKEWYLEAAKKAISARDFADVYFSVGVQATQPARGRGKQNDVIAIPAMWIDIDVKGPNHAAANLPPTIEDAWSILGGIPFAPTVVVRSGGGLQAYWLFREPLETVSEAAKFSGKRLSKGFQSLLRSIAATKGWTIDGTADLCRLLRLPGTYNRKQMMTVPVIIELINKGKRYNPSDFQELIELEADPRLKAHIQGPAPDNPNAEFRFILAGCAWMRHCKSDAEKLSEPEWYRALSIVGRCKDGISIAHELSKAYPRYRPAETEEKLRQAMGAAGPATCAFIENELGQNNVCEHCSHRGKIKSPIVLGIKKHQGSSSQGTPTATLACENAAKPRMPEIQVTDRQLRDMTSEALRALRDFNDPPYVFVRGGRAVRVTAEEKGRYIIAPATDDIVRNLLSRSANFYAVPNGRVRNCVPPIDVVRNLLALDPAEWGFPSLLNIITSPALREDGSLIHLAGYDPASRLFYAPDPSLVLPPLPEEPSTDHVQMAVEMILDILADFPFVDDASRTNAVAAILTSVCRPAIRGPTPLALIDATTQGTGKTLLSEIVSLIVCGYEGALCSAPRDPEEWRKQLTSVLLDGAPIVIIDNVTHRLDSADLCKALTESIHGDRILGRSQIVKLPVRCTWIATGNNIQLGGDMPRRCYWMRMDAKSPRPFERTGFRYDCLKQHVLAKRGDLLSALLTLARAWFVAGCPKPNVKPLGGFEDWTKIVGGILQHAGVEGFLANSAQLHAAADAESMQWELFLNILDSLFHGEAFTVAQVWRQLNEKNQNEETRPTFTPQAEELRSALPDYIAKAMDREGALLKQRLGFAFRERVGRRFGDAQYRIERAEDDHHAKVACWRVATGP